MTRSIDISSMDPSISESFTVLYEDRSPGEVSKSNKRPEEKPSEPCESLGPLSVGDSAGAALVVAGAGEVRV